MSTFDLPTSYDALNSEAQDTLLQIAKQESHTIADRGNLDNTNSGADYFEISISQMKALLAEAYKAGQATK